MFALCLWVQVISVYDIVVAFLNLGKIVIVSELFDPMALCYPPPPTGQLEVEVCL